MKIITLYCHINKQAENICSSPQTRYMCYSQFLLDTNCHCKEILFLHQSFHCKVFHRISLCIGSFWSVFFFPFCNFLCTQTTPWASVDTNNHPNQTTCNQLNKLVSIKIRLCLKVLIVYELIEKIEK